MPVFYFILLSTCAFSFFGCAIKSRSIANNNAGNSRVIDNKNSIGIVMAILTFSVLVYFVAMRSIYNDTYYYLDTFVHSKYTMSNLNELFSSDVEGKGFTVLRVLFYTYISKNYSIWFLFLAVVQIGAVIKLFYKYSCNYFMSAFLFVASGTLTWMMGGIRQFTAVCLILYTIDCVIEKKFLKFLVIVLLAATLHSTAILWLPVYFIVHFKPWSSKIWICVILTLIVVFGVDKFTTWLDSGLEGTDYEGWGTALQTYDDGVNIIRVVVAAVPAAFALWRRKYTENAPYYIDICTNLSVISVGVYLIGVVTSGIMVGRVPIYFTICNFVLLPWLIENTLDGMTRTIVKLCCYGGYLAYFYYDMVISGAGYYVSEKLGLYLW